MKTALLVPIYKQSKYFQEIYNGIESQTESPDSVYLILDRPTAEEFTTIKNICKNSKINYVILGIHDIPEYIGKPTNIPGSQLFLTGHRRNVGIDRAIRDGNEIFIFIDGDCIPESSLVESHKNACTTTMPIITCGRRNESRFGWRDQREFDPELKALDLFKKGGSIIYIVDLLKRSAIVWTCNFAINLKAVKLVKKLNKFYYNRDEVFSSEFLGSWGGEDSFLGLQSIFCKIIVSTISNDNAGIRHIDHPRPDNKYAYDTFQKTLITQVELLEYMFKKKPLTIDFFKED